MHSVDYAVARCLSVRHTPVFCLNETVIRNPRLVTQLRQMATEIKYYVKQFLIGEILILSRPTNRPST